MRGKALLGLPVLIALALLVWQSRLDHGWLEMALGGGAWLFWAAALPWAVVVGIGLKRNRAWWLLLTAPAIAYPVGLSILLPASCARGSACRAFPRDRAWS